MIRAKNSVLIFKYIWIVFAILMIIPIVKNMYNEHENSVVRIYDHPEKIKIIESIRSMMNNADGSFIIVNASNDSNIFIQYMNDHNRILFDLPDMNLSVQQRNNASEFFKGNGVTLVNTTGINPITGDKFQIYSWQISLNRDNLEEAANVGIGTLLLVYGLGNNDKVSITNGF